MSSTIFTTGTRQFVVHEAFESTWCFAGSYFWWFAPITIVMSSPLAGAEITTFLAPAARCLSASGRLVNRPVLSSTSSTPSAFHGSFSGSLIADTLMVLPLTTSASPCASTVPGKRPCTESYFRRSEEHTSELQSRLHLVCRLLLEKKKTTTHLQPITILHSGATHIL